MTKSEPGQPWVTKSGNASYCPDEGDFVWLQFNPQAGSEQANRRPALVLSRRIYNQKVKLCIVCPTTNQAKGYPFEVEIPNGNGVAGVVLADQVKSLSWDVRKAEFICTSPPEVIAEVRAKIKALAGIP